MAATRWRQLEDYHPAVRLMVRYMWRQEPPLWPAAFAERMDLPHQLVSYWLQVPAPPPGLAPKADLAQGQGDDGGTRQQHHAGPGRAGAAGAAAPEPLPRLTPQLAVRLARRMGHAPRELLEAAGLTTPDEPLLTVQDAWDYVVARVAAMAALAGDEGVGGVGGAGDGKESADDAAFPDAERLLRALERARAADLGAAAGAGSGATRRVGGGEGIARG
jgi:hypothetical protein